MSVLIIRGSGSSGGGGGDGSFTPTAGFSHSGSFNNGSSFTINKSGGGFGTGPTIVVFADFRGGTPGADVGLAQTIGSFSSTNSGSGSQKPYFMTGARDGDTCMSTMSDALGAADTWAQCRLTGMADFTQFYIARAVYGDFTTSAQNNSNQKDVWVTRDGNVIGGGHDIYQGAFSGIFSNSGGQYYFGSTSSADPPYHNQELPNGGYYPRNEWTFNEHGVKPNTVAGEDALIDAFGTFCNATDGWVRSSSTGLTTGWGSNGVTPAWNTMDIPGDYQDRPSSGHGVTPPYLTYYKWDDLYIAVGPNSWKRFLIGDASTLAACTALYIVPHTTWSDGSVTFTLPHTQWADLTGKHLFWIDNTYFTATRVGGG